MTNEPSNAENALIHFPIEYLPEVKELGLKYVDTEYEVVVIVPKIEYEDNDGLWNGPYEEQLCEHYDLDPDEVLDIEYV